MLLLHVYLKSISYFNPRWTQNLTLWGHTNLCSLYREVLLHPGDNTLSSGRVDLFSFLIIACGASRYFMILFFCIVTKPWNYVLSKNTVSWSPGLPGRSDDDNDAKNKRMLKVKFEFAEQLHNDSNSFNLRDVAGFVEAKPNEERRRLRLETDDC